MTPQPPRTSQARYATLADLDLVSPELSRSINAAASLGSRSIRETYLHRYAHSHGEFAAACEMAENLGLTVQ